MKWLNEEYEEYENNKYYSAECSNCRCIATFVGSVSKYYQYCPLDVQPVDRDSLQIVYIGRKAYHAKSAIMSAIESMNTIRDAIGHIEYAYSKHKELLSQISCCTQYGDVTPEIDYYINKIKEITSQID